MKELNGHITISRVVGSRSFVSIQLGDSDSGLNIVNVELSMEQFADAITGMGHVSCQKIVLNQSQNIGRTIEVTRKTLKPPKSFSLISKDEVRNFLAKFETDGWKGKDADIKNPHNWKGDKCSVVFQRWVEKSS